MYPLYPSFFIVYAAIIPRRTFGGQVDDNTLFARVYFLKRKLPKPRISRQPPPPARKTRVSRGPSPFRFYQILRLSVNGICHHSWHIPSKFADTHSRFRHSPSPIARDQRALQRVIHSPILDAQPRETPHLQAFRGACPHRFCKRFAGSVPAESIIAELVRKSVALALKLVRKSVAPTSTASLTCPLVPAHLI